LRYFIWSCLYYTTTSEITVAKSAKFAQINRMVVSGELVPGAEPFCTIVKKTKLQTIGHPEKLNTLHRGLESANERPPVQL
jgi:hypothetical protein